jgi:signal transduction histidine kinase
LDITELIVSLRKYILNSFKPDLVEVIVINKEGDILSGLGKNQSVVNSNEVSAILNVWENLNSNRILIFSELERSRRSGKRMLDENRASILQFMNSKKIEIIYPLDIGDGYSGIVVLGKKNDRGLYTVTDINFLESMVQTAQVSFQRATLYLEVEMLNRSLQEKVDEQTKELKLKVSELEEARKKENDMIDIMGHELRTPATVVKLNAELLEKYIGSNPDDFKRYLDRIKRAVTTEIGLINTLLTSAKLEGDKVEISHDKVDIKKEIEMAIHGHHIELQEKGLEYIDRTEGYQSFVYGDRVRVAEILNNLVSNAIKYTSSGHISVYTKHDDKFVTVSVEDTGKGIPEEKMSVLGKKFGRVDNYLGSEIVRPGGTGLGLYVTFGLVRMMGGDIWVDSVVGKGSKFTFTLPIYNGQKIDPEYSNNMFEKLGLKK